MSTLKDYKAVIAEASRPLRDRLIDIEAELVSLREEKTEIESILRKTGQLPSKNSKPPPKPSQVSADTLDRFLKALDALDVGTKFWASALVEDHRFDFISHSHITKALAALHERGDISLYAKGAGGRKIYVVTR